jgi:hypothetical protein
VKRTRREDVNRNGVAYMVSTWDDETGDAEILEYDDRDALLRRGVRTYWPRESEAEEIADGEVLGEVVWFDPDGVELERRPLRARVE